MRETSLKRTKRGYVRNLGRLPSGTQPKFYLGHDRAIALERLEQITTLWRHIEDWHLSRPGKPTWDDDTLQAAKALGRGEPATLGWRLARSPSIFSTDWRMLFDARSRPSKKWASTESSSITGLISPLRAGIDRKRSSEWSNADFTTEVTQTLGPHRNSTLFRWLAHHGAFSSSVTARIRVVTLPSSSPLPPRHHEPRLRSTLLEAAVIRIGPDFVP